MPEFRLKMVPFTPDAYLEAIDLYRNSRHFFVDIMGETAESIRLETIVREVTEAQEHCGNVVSFRLKITQQMIGIASYVPKGYNDQPTSAWVALLLISERFHLRGYGTEAYRLLEGTIFSDINILSIGLGVLENNTTALRFWRKMGYKTTGIKKQDIRGYKIILMEKQRKATKSCDLLNIL